MMASKTLASRLVTRLVRKGLVRECAREEFPALELITDALFEGREVALHSLKV